MDNLQAPPQLKLSLHQQTIRFNSQGKMRDKKSVALQFCTVFVANCESHKMTLVEFIILPKEDQIDLVYKHGVYIGKIKSEEITVLLYQLDAFYIQLCYLQYRVSIDNIQCYETTDVLEPYLEQIQFEYFV